MITGPNKPPELQEDTYTFQIYENVSNDYVIGVISYVVDAAGTYGYIILHTCYIYIYTLDLNPTFTVEDSIRDIIDFISGTNQLRVVDDTQIDR